METIREAVAVAEPMPMPDVRARTASPPSSVPDPPSRERDLALEIRMTASSLAGIALIHRDPDSESTR
jgi:hypothetical protein